MTLQADVRDADSRGAGSPRSQTESGSIRRGRIRFPLHDERHRELCSGGLCKKCSSFRATGLRESPPVLSFSMVVASLPFIAPLHRRILAANRPRCGGLVSG